MKKNLPSLDHLRVFEVAARKLSFKQAAEELNVTPAAVGQRIRSLEAHLGLLLFVRKTRQVQLTEAGNFLLDDVTTGLKIFEHSIEKLRPQRKSTVVRVSATNSYTELNLLPRLPDFSQRNPDVDVRIVSTNEKLDPNLDEIDVCIRFGKGNYPGLNSLRLGTCNYVPVCSTQLLQGRAPVKSVQDLLGFSFVEEVWSANRAWAPSWRSWFERRGIVFVPDKPIVSVTLESHAIKAAVEGQGVVLARADQVEPWLKSGGLTELLEPFGREPAAFEDHLVWRPHEEEPYVLEFLDWARSKLAAG